MSKITLEQDGETLIAVVETTEGNVTQIQRDPITRAGVYAQIAALEQVREQELAKLAQIDGELTTWKDIAAKVDAR